MSSQYVDGTREWRVDGELHRINEPAVERSNGDREWWISGKRHRADGPAIEFSNGTKTWHVDGKLHRADGPAVEWANGTKEWWIEGVKMSEDEFVEFKKTHSVMHIKANGDREWRQDGKLHRTDGPAVVGKLFHRTDGPAIEHHHDGIKVWYVDGKLHRIDGPAVDREDGEKWWYVNGKLHRTDGPAIEFSDGSKSWYIDGKYMLEEEFNEHCQSTKKKEIKIQSPANQWTVVDVQAFLLAMPADQVAAEEMQRAAQSAKVHKVDGAALLLLDTLGDIRCAFGIPCRGDCVKVLAYICSARGL